MATTVPPARGSSAGLPSPPSADSPPRRANAARIASVAALAGVVAIVLVLALAGSGGATYHLIVANASGLVRGDQVQVGGVPVGSVDDIALLGDYKVRLTIHVNAPLAPLHEGTTGEVRVPSLSSVANRYIALSPGPNNSPSLPSGSTLPNAVTHETVDLDQLFNTLDPKTRKGLQQFFQGFAEQYSGVEPQLRFDAAYFPPFLSATDHVLAELTREQSTFTNFLVETARTVTTLAAHKSQLTELVSNANTTFAAIGSQQSSLTEGLKALPVALKEGNRTFQELPATLVDLGKLLDVSRQDTKTLAPFLAKLRPLITAATPVVGNFSEAISKPGPNNDLTEVALALPALAKALSTASPNGVRAAQESLPITSLFGPYSPDLEGLIRDFGQGTSYYDANGHYARVGGIFPDFQLGENNTLKPVNPQQALQGLKSGQLRRCPGSGTQPAADGSSPFTNNGQLGCDPTQTP